MSPQRLLDPLVGVGLDNIRQVGANPVLTNTTSGTLYTCPVGKIALISGFQVYNNSATATTYTIYAVPSGGTQVANNICWSHTLLAAAAWWYDPVSVWLQAGDTFQYLMSGANQSLFTFRGIELPASSPIGLVRGNMASGGAAAAVYTCPLGATAKVFTFNINNAAFSGGWLWNPSTLTITLKYYLNVPSAGFIQTGVNTLATVAGTSLTAPCAIPTMHPTAGNTGWGLGMATTSTSATTLNYWGAFLEHRE